MGGKSYDRDRISVWRLDPGETVSYLLAVFHWRMTVRRFLATPICTFDVPVEESIDIFRGGVRVILSMYKN